MVVIVIYYLLKNLLLQIPIKNFQKYNNNMVKDFFANALETEKLSQLNFFKNSANGKYKIIQTKHDKN